MSLIDATPWAKLLSHCKDAKTAVIVAPYMKATALAEVLAAIADRATVTCVSRWTPRDIQLGTTDLACRELVLNHDGTFLLHDRLHAKYYRFDHQILIGSSNLTGAGMNVHPSSSNLEILCTAPPKFDAAGFETRLFAESYPVSDHDFTLWSMLTPDYPSGQTAPLYRELDNLENWRPTTRRPEYLWLAYQKRINAIPLAEQQAIASQELITLGVPPELNELEFNNWINLSLMTSPFVKSVIAIPDESAEAAWDRLSQQWNLSKAEAEHYRTTTQNWVEYFRINAAPDQPTR